MRLSKPLAILLIVCMTILAVVVSVPAILSGENKYNDLLQEARSYRDRNLCEKAMSIYDQILGGEESLDLRLEMAATYRQGIENGEFNSYYDFSNFLFETLEMYREEPSAYDAVAQHLYDFGELEDCVLVLYQAEEFNINTDTINGIRDDIRYMCSTNFATYEGVYLTHENTYLIRNEKYRIVSAQLSSIDGKQYEYATPMLNGYALVKDAKYTYLLNSELVREAYYPNEVTESTGVGDSLIACKIGEKFAYYDLTGTEVFGSYEFAGRFANGVAPVKTVDGWYLVDTNGNQIGDLIFEDIKLSQTNDCSQSGIIIAKVDGTYGLYDCALTRLSEIEFDDADTFINSSEPAAIMVDGKWGFVNASGEIVIEPQYEAARSFSNGLAGVKDGEYWSFINGDNEKVISGEFYDVNYFNTNGYCFVKDENYWFYLLRYYNK